MTEPRIRLLAAITTALGFIAAGFDAQVAPQSAGLWFGLTGSPSVARTTGAISAALLVYALGRVTNVVPFLGMAIGLLAFIPATSGWGTPLLFFSGNTMVLVFAILLGSAARDVIPRWPGLSPFRAALIAFVFFIFVGRFLPGPAGPQGDEPHYLLIAESLIKDFDVDLKNQFDERAFSKFTSAELEPHTAPRTPNGTLYAIHTPGLAALIAPGYALFGYAGARAVVSVVMAVVVGLLFFATRRLFGPGAASLVFALATFASPLPIYANALFPDSVAPLPVAATLAFLAAPSSALLGLASAAIAALPWMHPRFLPLACVLALGVSLRGEGRLRRGVLVFGPLVLSLGLLLFHFHSVFGSASLSAAYGPGFSSDVSLTHLPWGALALILDRQFGLLLFCPVLLFGLFGAGSLWKQDRMMGAMTLGVILVQLGVGGAFNMWWGGASPPARFLIGATPALLVLCGACWQAAERHPNRLVLLAASSGFGAGLLWLACVAPRALHNRADGESGLLRLLAPALDMDRFFAGFVNESKLWLALLWGLVLIASMLRPRLVLWMAALPVGFAMASTAKPLLDPFSSSLRALESWGNHRRTFGGSDSDEAFVLRIPLEAPAWDLTPGVPRYSPRFSLPRGSWTMRVESETESAPGVLNVARVEMVSDDGRASPEAVVMVQVGERIAAAEFNLPQIERRLRVRGTGLQSRTTILSVELRRRNPMR